MLSATHRQAAHALPLDHVPFVLLDIESTGLEAKRGDRICEIALLRLEDGEVTRRWQTLVDPGRPISAGAYAVNGIDDDALAGAPLFAEVADRLLDELDGAVIVAHNVPFDVEFLDTELQRLGQPRLPNIVLDTLTLARSFLSHHRYNLTALSRDLGFVPPSHRAMSDVIALQALFAHLLARLRMLGVVTLGDLVRAQRGLLPGEPEPEIPALIAAALRDGSRLRIAYRTKGADPVVREILPLDYRAGQGVPRLVAYCYLRNGQRTFYLDRMDMIEPVALVDGARTGGQ